MAGSSALPMTNGLGNTVFQAYPADALAFPPPTAPVDSLLAPQFPNGPTDGDRFDIPEPVENLEIPGSLVRLFFVAV
jgi:hypothetical protein